MPTFLTEDGTRRKYKEVVVSVGFGRGSELTVFVNARVRWIDSGKIVIFHRNTVTYSGMFGICLILYMDLTANWHMVVVRQPGSSRVLPRLRNNFPALAMRDRSF